MPDRPVVVGINRTQDGSVAVVTPDGALSLQKERLSRRKHHWGRLGDVRDRYVPAVPALREPVDLVVEGWSSDDEIQNVDEYHAELRESLTFRGGEPRIVRVSHHLTHLYSAFPPSPFDRAAGVIVDAQGSRVRNIDEDFADKADLDPGLLEVASVYSCERGGRIECLGKHLWDGDWDNPVGLGCFYYLLTRLVFTGEGSEGKLMGLAPFGRPGSLGLPELPVDEFRVSIPDAWMKIFAQKERYSYFIDGKGSFEECADLAAEGQRAFETALLQVLEWARQRTGADNLVFAGGTALNCSANGRIIRESGFRGVFVPPSPHDGGTALGAAIWGLEEVLGGSTAFRWEDDFLGPEPSDEAIRRAVERATAPLEDGSHGPLIAEQPDDLAARMAELLDSGRVVSLYQGRSESGPRALGNRSIIADARNPAMQDYINFQVKGREWFRPLAPLVLADRAQEVFDVDRPAPFMQYAAQVREEWRERLPAITHVDNSARLQTVNRDTTPFLHELLRAFEARTGTPVLLNTSLNGKGDPLVETPEHAIDTLLTTGMHALAIGPWLLRKRDEPTVP